MIKFGIILLASYACALPPSTKTASGFKTPQAPGNYNPPPKACICTFDYRPVCGTDGKTYGNQCALDCEKTKNPDLKKTHDGPCADVAIAQKVPQLPTSTSKPCICTMEYMPVCGTDGKTYGNQCALDCEKAQNPALEKKHNGPCSEVSESKQAPQTPMINQINISSCQCTKEKRPVCGTDHVTYSNICLLNCAANTKPVEKKSDGPCVATTSKGVQPPTPICPCPRNYDPVCGSDGVTYDNYCMFECARKEKPGLTKVYNGRCGHQQPANNVKS